VYCNLKMTGNAVASAGTATTAGNRYLSTTGICATCDNDANGCDGLDQAKACKTAGNVLSAGKNCVKKCDNAKWEYDIGYDGKCNSGCVSNVASKGTVKGGALNGQDGGCYGMEGREAQLCNKGHHVQGASVGKCCNDDNAATGLAVGSMTLASVFMALYFM
jgi:hypothetical protein